MFKGLFKPNIDTLARDNDVQGLVQLVMRSDEQTTEKAAKALREMELRDVKTVKHLCNALENENIIVRESSALGLGLAIGKLGIFAYEYMSSFKQLAPIVLDSLISLAEKDEGKVLSMAATALSQLSPIHDVKGVQCLFRLADSNDITLKRCAKVSVYFWAIEAHHPSAPSTFSKMFMNSTHAFSFPDSDRVEETYKELVKGEGITNEVAIKELARQLRVMTIKASYAERLSQETELEDFHRQFYLRISAYWATWLQGKNLKKE